MSKILVSDYDKTFYLNDIDMEENKIAVNNFIKEKNIFIIATGRSFLDFKNVVNKYKFYYDYAILNQGVTIIDNKDNVIYNTSMDNKIIKDIINDLNLDKSINYFCCSGLDSRVNIDHIDLNKINVKYESNKTALSIKELLEEKYNKYIYVYNISDSKIEIVSKKSNKSEAIKLISNMLNIDKNNIYTIGDGYSDVGMIKDFNGYCVRDSVDEVKQVSIKEVGSVNQLIKELRK